MLTGPDGGVAALSLEEGRARLAQHCDPAWKRLAVAVSGGADSFALLLLLRKWKTDLDLICLTVNHGLREEAALEAEAVARWCAAHGIRHETLNWQGKKPATGVQATARNTRYYLLADACVRHDVDALLTAHNLDDQAETVFAQLARGAGSAGLAGMKPQRLIAAGAAPPVPLVRPLLAVPRDRLQALAAEADLPVQQDASNEDFAYERVRRRAFLAASSVQKLLSKEALLRSAERLALAREAEEELLRQDFATVKGLIHGTGAICLDKVPFDGLGLPRQKNLIARLTEGVSGSVSSITVNAVPELELTQGRQVTFGGALLLQSGEKLWIVREPAALLGRKDGSATLTPLPVAAETTVLYDRRFIVQLADFTDQKALTLQPLGRVAEPLGLQSRLVATMPSLFVGNELVACPPYAKKIMIEAGVPWKRKPLPLDIQVLTAERLARRVIRYQRPE